MEKDFESRRVINGTYGEIWNDGKAIAECNGFECKIAFDTADIKQCKKFYTGTKITGGKITGTIKIYKVDSSLCYSIAQQSKNGVFKPSTIISNLKDPDSYGAERVKVTGVLFTEATLADWAAGTPGEQSYPFTATDFDFLDKISA